MLARTTGLHIHSISLTTEAEVPSRTIQHLGICTAVYSGWQVNLVGKSAKTLKMVGLLPLLAGYERTQVFQETFGTDKRELISLQ
jgi:hypothetical protein